MNGKIIHIFITLILSLAILVAGEITAFSQTHIKDLDSIRTSLSEFGSSMPDTIRKAERSDIRTLERLFEINTYALTTIEAYFKMVKIAVSSESEITKDTIHILNGWLNFIGKYCEKDMDYFNEAISDTKDENVIKMITKAKSNIQRLYDITSKGIDENKNIFEKGLKQ